MFEHPFLTTETELNEYIEAMEAFADAANQLPDPEPPDDGDWGDCPYEGDEDRYLDSYWEDQSEYGMDGCCGDF